MRLNLQFSIDKEWCFINHGAFGASPLVLQRAASRARVSCGVKWLLQQALKHLCQQTECEQQPLRFVDRELLPRMIAAVQTLADHLRVSQSAERVLPTPHATAALNAAMRCAEKGDVLLLIRPGTVVRYLSNRS